MPGAFSIRSLVAAQELTSDLDVLNYALTLEHLEYAFYRDGVGLFTFGNDGRGQSIDTNFAAIRDHEGAHVETLTSVITDLGGEPVAEATYDFGGCLHRSDGLPGHGGRAGEHRRQRL